MTSSSAYRGALQLSVPAGWDQEILTNVAADLSEDIDPDRHTLAHSLWTFGAPPMHDGCRYEDGDYDADYQNDCGVCEGYLLAIADRALAYLTGETTEQQIRAEEGGQK